MRLSLSSPTCSSSPFSSPHRKRQPWTGKTPSCRRRCQPWDQSLMLATRWSASLRGCWAMRRMTSRIFISRLRRNKRNSTVSCNMSMKAVLWLKICKWQEYFKSSKKRNPKNISNLCNYHGCFLVYEWEDIQIKEEYMRVSPFHLARDYVFGSSVNQKCDFSVASDW